MVVQRDTVRATRSAGSFNSRFDLTLPVAIHNAGSRPVALPECTEAIEAPAGSEWRTVWSPVICRLSARPLPMLRPGETLEVNLSFAIEMQGTTSSSWRNDTLDGTYRVSLGIMPDGQSGVMPRVGSNAFVLVGP
jgi:hypothetical protein